MTVPLLAHLGCQEREYSNKRRGLVMRVRGLNCGHKG